MFGQRLKWVLDNCFTTQMHMCYEFRISSVTQLKAYIQGLTRPAFQVFEAAVSRGYSTDWLLCGVGTFHNDSPAGHALRDRCAAAGITPPAELSKGAQA
jgi:hypothetical protein